MLSTVISALAAMSTIAPGIVENGLAAKDVREWVRQTAFDPLTYFPSSDSIDHSTVRIIFQGSYGWHGYSIAIAPHCIAGETIPADACLGKLRARMVRAPQPASSDIHGVYGSGLIATMVGAGVRDEEDVREVLRSIDLEWLEADLRTCSGAVDMLARSADADWVPRSVSHPDADDWPPAIVLHPDNIVVEIQEYARLTRYSGWSAEGSPAVWARQMADVLEPCWIPSAAPTPWSQ